MNYSDASNLLRLTGKYMQVKGLLSLPTSTTSFSVAINCKLASRQVSSFLLRYSFLHFLINRTLSERDQMRLRITGGTQ